MTEPHRLPGAFCALAVAIGAAGSAACAGRAHPYRFSSPLLGGADVPPAWSGKPEDPDDQWRRPDADDTISVQNRFHRSPRTPAEDPRPGAIRVASAQAAAAVTAEPTGVAWSKLPAHGVALDAPHAPLREPADLRTLVGRRDQHDSVAAALGWEAELGTRISLDLAAPAAVKSQRDLAAAVIAASLANTSALVAWAASHDHLVAPIEAIDAGDILVFERTESQEASDLVGIAIGRDARGVIEFIYCAGGAIRRGLVDPRHPAQHRETSGAVVNTFMRTGNRWPPKGTHYLAGELLVHVVRVR